MKSSLFIVCFFLSLRLFAQEKVAVLQSDLPTTVTTFTMYGYIDGKRLDSLASTYATYGFRGGDGVTFDYGQMIGRQKEALLTDSKGQPLIFPERSNGFLLNFFHYNHWEFVNTYQPGSANGSGTALFILKKQP